MHSETLRAIPSVDHATEAGAGLSREDRAIDHLVVELNRIGRAATFDFTIAIGKLVIDRLYRGDLVAWRHRGLKATSFRRLAKHPDLPMSPGALYRCVAIYELCERLGIRSWKHVSTSHLRLVLPLSPNDQERLLSTAETSHWSVRQLEHEIAGIIRLEQQVQRRRGGRRRQSPIRRAVHTFEHCIDACTELLTQSDDGSPESRELMLKVAERMERLCAHLEQRYRQHLPAAKVVRSGQSPVPDGGDDDPDDSGETHR